MVWNAGKVSGESTPSCWATTLAPGATACSALTQPSTRCLPVSWIWWVSSATWAWPPEVLVDPLSRVVPTSLAPCRLSKMTQPSTPGSALSE